MLQTKQLILVLLSLAAATAPPVALGLENGLALTPPMGWIAWERFTDTIDCDAYPNDCLHERLFKQMADRLVEDGYKEVGYQYINLDDCWSEKSRDSSTSNLIADKSRFPNGLRLLSNYMHEKGLKFGIYGDCGTATCAGWPAQLKTETNLEDNYFDLDAHQFADWHIDSLKFDGCYLSEEKQEKICPKMATALERTGRPILLICEHPQYMMRKGLKPDWPLAAASCNTWRYFEDVEDSWLSVLNIIDFTTKMQNEIFKVHGPGQWFDPDQIVVGNYGLSLDQARVQMAIWSLWSAPLFMSNDLRSMDPEMAAVLKNKQLIDVDQDKLGIFGLLVDEQFNKTVQAFVKPVLPVSPQFGCPSFVVLYLDRGQLGPGRDISFNLRDLLLKGKELIDVAEKRGNSESIRVKADECKRLLEKASTVPRRAIASDGVLVVSAGQTSQPPPELPIEEQQVKFNVVDLFNDSGAPQEISLDSSLNLRVNPNGVRMIKLTISEVK